MGFNIEWNQAAINRIAKLAVRKAAEKARSVIEATVCPDHKEPARLVTFADPPAIRACCPKNAERAAKAAGFGEVRWESE